VSSHAPTVTVFGPDPLLSIAIERRGEEDDIHIHAGGQGVWVARMIREMGATPILCSLIGGESGATLTQLLDPLIGETRLVAMAGANGTYVVDRRGPDRQVLASSWRPAPQRHEIDDLVSATCAAALHSELLVLCNPFPATGLAPEVYEAIAADAAASGVPLLVDLSSPRLDRALRARPALVKLNDWELAEYVCGPVDGDRAVDAAQSLIAAGAQAVAVTRAGAPILVVEASRTPYEVVPPTFPCGHREGCGDAMTGALAACLARGAALREALPIGAAAGSCNFLRHGLGSGRRKTIEELVPAVVIRPAASAAKTAA
jgi:1-phosphofructokinase